MSLLSILQNSSTALANTETAIGVASQNIANAQTVNYVREVANTATTSSGGQVVDVTRAVNKSLQSEVLSQTTTNAGSSALSTFYTQLDELTGASSSTTPALVSATQGLQTALQDLSTTPESTSAQQAVETAASSLVSTVQTLSSGIETMASQVQSQTSTDVASLNADLASIASLNRQIIAAKASNQSTSDLEGQRDQAVADAAQYVPLNTQEQSDGSLSVSTPDGVSMVAGTNAVSFKLTPYTLGANGVAGTNETISIVGDTSNTALNGSFGQGKIGTELSILRVDDAGAGSTSPSVAPLEKLRRQLDAFVDQFYSSSATSPTAFQNAYNSAAGTTGQLSSNLFVVNNQGNGGSPQPAGSDRSGFVVNPALLSGSATLKTGAANALLTAMTTNNVTNLSAGDVSSYSGTIEGYAASIATAESTRSSSATATAQQNAATLSSVQTSYSNATGVSSDTELSNLIVLQNSYNASAKVISVIDTAFQSLLGALQ